MKRAPKRALTDAELEGMRSQCASTRDAAVFEVLRVTGCREHEMLALRFKDVDFETRRVWFHKTKARVRWNHKVQDGKRIRTHAESEIEPRWSFLSDSQSMTAMRIYVAERTKEEGRDFTDTLKVFKMTSRTVRNLIKSLAVRAKLHDAEDVSPHWLRHTRGTKMLSKGVPIPYIKETMGWSKKSRTFEETYEHSDVDMIQNTIEDLMGTKEKEKPKDAEKDNVAEDAKDKEE